MTEEGRRNPVQILLVEDDSRIAELRSEMLEQRGCMVIQAHTFESARQLIESSPPVDLVVMDIQLGDQSDDQRGLELARMVRDALPELPIVGYTAVFSADELPPDEQSGFERLFAKGTMSSDDIDDATDWMVELAHRRREPDVE